VRGIQDHTTHTLEVKVHVVVVIIQGSGIFGVDEHEERLDRVPCDACFEVNWTWNQRQHFLTAIDVLDDDVSEVGKRVE